MPFTSLKKIIGIIGGVALLASAAGGLKGASASSISLDNLVAQEAFQQTAQTVDEQRYADIKKMFDDADGVVRGVVEKVSVGYNRLFNNICTVYYLQNNVNVYKFDKRVMDDEYTAKAYPNKAKGSRSWSVQNPDGSLTSISMPIVYGATKPGTIFSAEDKNRTEKAGITPSFDDMTPDLKPGDHVIIALQKKDGRGKNLGLTNYYVIEKDPAVLPAFKKLLADLKISDNYEEQAIK